MTFRTITHDDWIAAIRHARKWRTARAQAIAQARTQAGKRNLPGAPAEVRPVRETRDGGHLNGVEKAFMGSLQAGRLTK
jgi:hypothetical protein